MRYCGSVAIPALAVLAVAAFAAAEDPALPSAEQIVERYIAAAGGRDAIAKIKTRVSKGTIEIATYRISGTLEQYSKVPSRQVTRSDISGYGIVIQCFDGNSGWASDPARGVRDFEGRELALHRRNADIHSALHLNELYPKMRVTGQTKVGERDAYVIEATPPQGTSEKLFFDARGGLLLRSEFETPQGAPAVLVYDDYKEVDGVTLPFTIRQDSADLSVVVRLQEVKQNVPVDDAKFVRPAK